MKLVEIVHAEAIIPRLQAETRDEAIAELVRALGAAGAVSEELVPALTQGVIDRENQASTGFGKGIAIPHVKSRSIARPIAAIGNSGRGIEFRSLDGQPVYSVVLLLSPDSADQHLAAMNVIWPKLNNERFRKFLRQAKSRAEIEELMREADEH